MKKLILILALCGTAQANVVDETPGGFDVNHMSPAVTRIDLQLLRETFFDQAVHNFPGFPDGWVGLYGLVNGADYFGTDLFGHDTPLANISWNLTAAFPEGYWLSMIHVYGQRADGSPWENIYGVPFSQRFNGTGVVTLDGNTTIMSIDFYGINTVPEKGSTLLLLALWAAIMPCISFLAGHFATRKQ